MRGVKSMIDWTNPLDNGNGVDVEWGPYSPYLYNRGNINFLSKDFPNVHYSTSPHYRDGGLSPRGLLPRALIGQVGLDG